MKFKVGDHVQLIQDIWPEKKIRKAVVKEVLDMGYLFIKFYCNLDKFLIHSQFVKKQNNRGMNPRNAHGRFVSKRQSDFDKIFWSVDLPDTMTINGVKYVKEVK